MNAFTALLTARAHEQGRAQRTAKLRHRAIAKNPLCIAAYQLGAEPYSIGAIAFGTQASGTRVFVPGYPLNRQLLFDELLRFAKEFCPALEAYANSPCEEVEHFGQTLLVPKQLPQVIVANNETISLLGRLGRRLAFLPVEGKYAADPLLPRLGRHLLLLAQHAKLPGQQLVLSVTELLATHYVTAMSNVETGSLAALNVWINPPEGAHGFHAAEVAERQAVGPTPSPSDGETIFGLMNTFNERRKGSTDAAVVQKCVQPLRTLYGSMIQTTWNLIWQALDRERAIAEASSIKRREREDRIAYASHMAWMNGPAGGRRRTRMTARNAALRLDALERAQTRLIAEEAIDDPLRMAPILLAGKALAGKVIARDVERREVISGRNCLRPSITVRTCEPCAMPRGAELWWTETSGGREWAVHNVASAGGGSDVTLVLRTNRLPDIGMPKVGGRVTFSQLNTGGGYELFLPAKAPWTHRAPEPPTEVDLDYNGLGAEAA